MTATPSSAPRQPIVVQLSALTDVGRTREHNEDVFAVADLTTGRTELEPELTTHTVGERGSLFIVADGMGGAAAGELASSMAVETIVAELRQRGNGAALTGETFAGSLRAATEVANERIHRYAVEHPENRGMGTTATVAGLLGDTLYLAQVGDSRAYLVRDGVARQLTKDQSLMQKLIEAGEITPEEAEQSERRNIILQALGPEPTVRTDVTHQLVRRGDVLILCSDGLSGLVRAEEIADVVDESASLDEVCAQLVDLANSRGGPDNITVVAARFDGAGLEAPVADEDVGHRPFPLPGDAPTPVAAPRFVRKSRPVVAIPRPRSERPHGRTSGLLLIVGVVAILVAIVAAVVVRFVR